MRYGRARLWNVGGAAAVGGAGRGNGQLGFSRPRRILPFIYPRTYIHPTGHGLQDNPPCELCGAAMELVRHVSFVDCPGHDILMATMLNGAAVMDGALLLIAANETCPQPQTSEHLAAVEIMRLKDIIILQVRRGGSLGHGAGFIAAVKAGVGRRPRAPRRPSLMHADPFLPGLSSRPPAPTKTLPPTEQDRPDHRAQRHQPARRHQEVHPGHYRRRRARGAHLGAAQVQCGRGVRVPGQEDPRARAVSAGGGKAGRKGWKGRRGTARAGWRLRWGGQNARSGRTGRDGKGAEGRAMVPGHSRAHVLMAGAITWSFLSLPPRPLPSWPPPPRSDFVSPPQMIVIRSFDVNKPGSEVDELKGGVAGGSILQVRARAGAHVWGCVCVAQWGMGRRLRLTCGPERCRYPRV